MKPTDLREILQYVPQFREKTFVLAIDGAIVTDENFATLLQDVAVLWSLSIRVVLVHGASAQVRSLAAQHDVKASDFDGAGITDAATLELALTAANRLTHEILEGLSANDLRAASTNVITAHPMGIIQGVDHLFTGKVERVDVELLQSLLAQGVVPVIPPLGFDGDGKTYRVNSDGVAVAVAAELKAMKLIFITSQDGLSHGGQPLRQVPVAELETLLHDRAGFPRDMWSKAQHAAAACKAGVPRVHVINGKRDEGLLAVVFSNDSIGTLVYANEYQQIRPAKKKDVRAIQLLTKQGVEADELIRRSRAALERTLGDYFIFEIDKNPVACVALHVYPEPQKGELASLYVSSSHENQGIGRKLIQFVESRARELGLRELLVLSTQAFTYFQSKGGFAEGTPGDLPPARREEYEQSGRNSKVLVKTLN
uniref:amino-acid N-acetyltransferase n=1 Tax=uncultured bacterium 213 TaxID=698383 RepID=E3T6W3_9BACT|nr:N-acetylglutamate synthase [uncultured bacterium 213]